MPKISASIWRGVVAILSFGIPLLFTAFPHWADLTVGGIVFAALHYLEKTVKGE